MNSLTANYDESWKEALDVYFDSFLAFFFEDIYHQIDWTKTPQSLDKELQQITASADTELCIADKLYQVWLLDKQHLWLLIHIEVQSQYDNAFPQRMYIYNYRAFDLYHRPVISLAVLGDERRNWRPTTYHCRWGECELTFKFPMVKLLDYELRWSELTTSSNPFAMIVMAHLKTKATSKNPEEREKWKWLLVRGLYERGLTKDNIIKLFQIIDRMMTLPSSLQENLDCKLYQFEEEQKMPLLSNLELRGMERGQEIGALKKGRDYITIVLNSRLGDVPNKIQQSLSEVTNIRLLDQILEIALIVNSWEEFEQSLMTLLV